MDSVGWHYPLDRDLSSYLVRAVIKRQGLGCPSATKKLAPSYLHRKIEEKMEPKEILNCMIPCRLVVFTWQLEIVVTALSSQSVIHVLNNVDLEFKFYLSLKFYSDVDFDSVHLVSI